MGAPADKSLALQLDRPQMSSADDGVVAPMPKPKSIEHSPARAHVPTADDLLHGRVAPIISASTDNAALLATCNACLDEVFVGFATSLSETVEALRETPPPAETDWAGYLLGLLVNVVTQVALAAVAEPIALGFGRAFGGVAETATRTAFRNIAKTGGEAAGRVASARRPMQPDRMPDVVFTDLAAKTLLDEYASRQSRQLSNAHTDARIALILLAPQLGSADQPRMAALTTELLAIKTRNDARREVELSIAAGWLNFVTQCSLGPKRIATEPDLPGSHRLDGYRETFLERSTLAGGLQIVIAAPSALSGTRGLELVSARSPKFPGAARVLSRCTEYSLASLPVYREIVLSFGESALSKMQPLWITPTGDLEADWDSPQLAAIGCEGWEMQGPDEPETFDVTRPSAYQARRMINAGYAAAGAARIKQWLAGVSAGRISE